MISLVATLLLAQSDAGFEPFVLNVHHGEVYETTADGGASPTPTLMPSGTCMDDATTEWVAQNKARWRAEAQSARMNPDVRWVLGVAASFFGLGILAGAWGAWELFKLVR